MYYSKNGVEISSKHIFDQLRERETILESPVRLAGLNVINVNFIGAFTFFRGGSIQQLDSIGRFCSVAPNVCIGPTEHEIKLLTTSTFINSWKNSSIAEEYWTNSKNTSSRQEALKIMRHENANNCKSVKIGSDVWIGQNVVIRKGVTIGNGAIVAANSVVAKDVKSYEIVGGVPAEHIRFRFDLKQIVILEKTKWWEWSLKSLNGLSWSNIDLACEFLLEKFQNNSFNYADYGALKLSNI